MITLAVFDMAGTTIDDGGAVYDALRLAVEETGVVVSPEDLQTWMGTEKSAAIAALIELGGGDPHSPADKVAVAFGRFRTLLGELYAATPPTAIQGLYWPHLVWVLSTIAPMTMSITASNSRAPNTSEVTHHKTASDRSITSVR